MHFTTQKEKNLNIINKCLKMSVILVEQIKLKCQGMTQAHSFLTYKYVDHLIDKYIIFSRRNAQLKKIHGNQKSLFSAGRVVTSLAERDSHDDPGSLLKSGLQSPLPKTTICPYSTQHSENTRLIYY